MKHLLRSKIGGYDTVGLVISLVAASVVVLVAYLLLVHSSPSNTPSQNSSTVSSKTSVATDTDQILSPASVPPKTAECSQQLIFASNGVSGPITCSDGDLNITEWNAIATLEPSVLTLGYYASFSQVQSALCKDVGANVSNPDEEIAYQIASLYYDWNFTTNPSVVLTNGTCVNVDD